MRSKIRASARRNRAVAAVAAAAACIATLGASTSPASAGTIVEEARGGGTIIESTFSRPPADGSGGVQDATVTDHLTNLVRNAHRDATIKIALHSLGGAKGGDFKNAIVAAASDGGSGAVKVIYDGTKMGTVPTALKNELTAAGGQFVQCGNPLSTTDGACISPNPNSNQHAKYVLINIANKTTGTLSRGYHWNTVWMGSANMTPESGWDAYNDAVTVYGDTDLYAGLEKVFDKAFLNNWAMADFYSNPSPEGYAHGPNSNVTVWASPEADSDHVLNRLNEITPQGGGACQLRVMMSQFMGDPRGIAVAEKLLQLRNDGCWMWVIVGHKNGVPAVGDQVKATLCGRVALAAYPNIHDKALIFKGLYQNATRNIVFTGSHNITNQALRDNDEILVRVGASSTTYNEFQSHFASIYSDDKKIC